ncbi:MAG: hypothetical protein HY238_12415 [Acidobacteria bacterium]|nr:hypothetical protein [Acidobacteriota bacterium]
MSRVIRRIPHADRKALPLDMAGADARRIGVASDWDWDRIHHLTREYRLDAW